MGLKCLIFYVAKITAGETCEKNSTLQGIAKIQTFIILLILS